MAQLHFRDKLSQSANSGPFQLIRGSPFPSALIVHQLHHHLHDQYFRRHKIRLSKTAGFIKPEVKNEQLSQKLFEILTISKR